MTPPTRLVDCATFYPPHLGGLEQFAATLHHELVARTADLDVTVVTSDRGGGAPASRPEERVTVLRYPAHEPVKSFAFPRWRAWRAVLRRLDGPPDVVVTHTRFFPASVLGGRLARRHGARWIHIEHGATFVQSGGWLVRTVARTYDATLGRWVLRRADDVVAISQAVADFVAQLSGRTARVVYRGIDVPAEPWVRPTGAPRIVFVGRLIDGKGVDDLLHAHAALATDVELEFVGDGPERARLEQTARDLGTAERVHFTGSVPPDEVQSRLRAAHVFVNPSWSEGLPTTVLEAAAIGMPIVATDVGGTREIVQDEVSGLLVPCRARTTLAAALGRLLENPDEADCMGAAARARGTSTFTWEAAVSGVMQLIDSTGSSSRHQRNGAERPC